MQNPARTTLVSTAKNAYWTPSASFCCRMGDLRSLVTIYLDVSLVCVCLKSRSCFSVCKLMYNILRAFSAYEYLLRDLHFRLYVVVVVVPNNIIV